MHILISYSVCLLLAVTAVAQKPQPCKSPPLMVGRISVVFPKGELFMTERFSYDALGHRIRVRAEGIAHNQSFHDDVLILYRERVMYEISYKNHTCTKRPMTQPFRPIEIPQDAMLLNQIILGSSSGPGQGLLVNVWNGEFPEQKEKYILTFTEFGCIPVSGLYNIGEGGWIVTSFFDLVLGIEDPQEFIPPDFCETKPVEEEEEVVTHFFNALLKKDGK